MTLPSGPDVKQLKVFFSFKAQPKAHFLWKPSQQPQSEAEPLLGSKRIRIYILLLHKTLHHNYLFACLSPLPVPLRKSQQSYDS